MPMVELNDLLPTAQWEDNWTFFGEHHEGLAKGDTYVVFEYYCDNPECDCQNLLAEVLKLDTNEKHIKKSLALINYGWSSEEKKCYPVLSEDSPKDRLAYYLLDVYKKFIHHPNYIERVQDHYARVKKLAYEKQIQNQHQGKQTTSKIGRNEPCICGSGKKYKKCCMNRSD
jgi:hypothetical protein